MSNLRLGDERIDEIARILDGPQLKRLGGVILSLSLDYVLAVQEAPVAIRQLRAVARAGGGRLEESTQGVDVGPVVPAPWQIEQVGEAWRAVYDGAHAVTAAWLMTEHATPRLTEKLQALSVALMTLDQRRLATPAPMDGDTYTWKERAERAEAALGAAPRDAIS